MSLSHLVTLLLKTIRKQTILITILLILLLQTAQSQVAINTTGNDPDASAILDITSTEKGMLAPRMTTVQRTGIVTPANGLLVYDTDTKSFWYYNNDNTEWVEVISGALELNDLSDAITSENSISLGTYSGLSNSAPYNTSLGIKAMRGNTTGEDNTALGHYSLANNITGSWNTVVGSDAASTSNGNANTILGTNSFRRNTTGSGNVSVGMSALDWNISGSNNTAIGTSAGRGSDETNFSGCVFIGSTAGYSNTSDNKLYIENSASETPLIGGDFSTDQVDINGTIKITGGTPGNGKILTSDADGLASWENNPGATVLNDLGDALTNRYSVFVGSGAGEDDDGWNYNTGIGEIALPDNTSGKYNSGLGYGSLFYNKTGNYNVAVGHYSISGNIVGDSNTFVGSYSGMDNEGDNNCGFGFGNMRYNIGDNNTAIGQNAGYGTYDPNTSYSGCILIGYESGKNNTADNKLYIENSDSDTPLIGGDFSTNQVDINGTIKITGGTPGNGKVLTSDADGLASWEPTSGATELNDLSDAITDGTSVYIGTSSGVSNSGTSNNNTSVGYEALRDVTTGEFNTALGSFSLCQSDTGIMNTVAGSFSATHTNGDYNTILGAYNFYENTSGSGNIAIGTHVLWRNTTGNNNTSIGRWSLHNTSTGNENTALGYEAGFGFVATTFSGCVFLGSHAGYNNTSDNKLYIDNSTTSFPLIGGDFSTDQVDINGTLKITGGTPGEGKVLTSDADGLSSWQIASVSDINSLSDAIYNGSDLFLGNGAGNSNSGTNNNVAVGRDALNSSTSNDYNTAVGNLSLELSTGERNTAVGYYSMHGNTTGSFNTSLGYRTGFSNVTGSNNTFIGYNARMTNSTIRVNSTAIGNDAVITGSDQVRIGNSSVTSIGGQVSWTTLSDGRFKENVQEDVAGLDFVLNLRPVSYTVNKQAFKSFVGSEYESNNRNSSQRECGFVAQEVEELIQNTGVEFNGVDTPENGDDYYGIRYSQFVIPLVKSVQELNEKLEQENTKLKAQNKEMLQRIEKLEEIILKK